MNNPRNIVLILAGGEGVRAKQPVPKQYVKIEGIPVLAYTIRTFDRHPLIDAIYVVCRDKWRDYVEQFTTELEFAKFRGTFPAGDSSIDSIRNGIRGLQEIESSDSIVLVHDGVRPLVSADIISDSIRVCRQHGNAIAAMQGEEAYMSGDDEKATEMIPREQLWGAQTPHTFPLNVMLRAFDDAAQRGITKSQSLYTLMAQLNYWPLYKSRGERVNLKITNPDDIWLFSRLASVL